MTEQQLRAKMVNQMRSWLGRCEADHSHEAIIDIYNQVKPHPREYELQYDDEWCAGGITACGYACGMGSIIYPECSCGHMVGLYQKHDRWVEDDQYIPTMGDLLFFYWKDNGKKDCTEWPQHVGLVEEVKDGMIITIECNRGEAVARRQTPIGGKYIRGFGLPDYASLALPDWESEWPAAMEKCKRAGIMDGNRPLDAVTRRELAVVLDRLGLTGGA